MNHNIIIFLLDQIHFCVFINIIKNLKSLSSFKILSGSHISSLPHILYLKSCKYSFLILFIFPLPSSFIDLYLLASFRQLRTVSNVSASSVVAWDTNAPITTICSVNIVPASNPNDAWQKQTLKSRQSSSFTKLMDADSNLSSYNAITMKPRDVSNHQFKPCRPSQNLSNNAPNTQIDVILNSTMKGTDEQIPIKSILQSNPDRTAQSYIVVRGQPLQGQPGTQDAAVQYLVSAKNVQFFQPAGFQIPLSGQYFVVYYMPLLF